MSRAVILPTPGDPFLIKYWIDNFQRIWASEIDRLYVTLNSPAEPAVIDYIRKTCTAPNIVFNYIPQFVDHGEVINRTLNALRPEVSI